MRIVEYFAATFAFLGLVGFSTELHGQWDIRTIILLVIACYFLLRFMWFLGPS